MVSLDGEAYFDVAENPSKPFIIKANGTEVKVLGTSFNVKSLGNETEVTVTSGRVQFSKINSDMPPVILTKDEKGMATPYKLKKEANSNPNFLSWKTGKFHFEDTDLSQVIFDLSRFYGKKLKIKEQEKIDCQLTADFNGEDLPTILEIIRRTCDLQIEETTDQIWLSR